MFFCAGDFFQLPPVMERALYYAVDSSASLQYIQGRLAYESFEYTAILSRIMRQEVVTRWVTIFFPNE